MTTGERVYTAEKGFNPTFQRHVAAYRLAAPLLPQGRILDLGCGVGHSFRELAPRQTVGVDIDPSVLSGQARETVAADMRQLPFPTDSFEGVISVQSIEHVPDPERVLAEVSRVMKQGGRAVFVTPNRLTFGLPDEIIDPYHFREYASEELAALLRPFARVEVRGLFGSPRYMRIVEAERGELDRVLALDPLRVRRAVPRRLRQRLYDVGLARSRRSPRPGAEAITPEDFHLGSEAVDEALDLVAICDLG